MAATYDIHWGDVDLDGCDRICIDHRENICSICAKPYTHRKRYFWKEEDKTIKDVELITAHPSCRSITRQIEEHQQKILDLEFKLFVFKTS
jgi:hypothetical protein